MEELGSACDKGWLVGELLGLRARTLNRTKAVDRGEVQEPLARLFLLLYETATCADEALGLDVDDLDVRNQRAKVQRKGGAVDIVVWRTPPLGCCPTCSTRPHRPGVPH
ncbi:hypothetical protein ACQP2T_61050 [Nonomuraea sp. CA-143628]|uniref:hypothetical protein n=1 Tax=Nonomuraea sp. CA-143628 TaxID=3239997 RepID=UPI003D8D4CC6